MVRVNRDDLLETVEAFREEMDAFATAMAFLESGCLHVNATLLAIEDDRVDQADAMRRLEEAKRMLQHARSVLEDEHNVKGRVIAYVDRYMTCAEDLLSAINRK